VFFVYDNGEKGEKYIIEIKHVNAAPELSPGDKISIAGHYDRSSKKVILVDGDHIRKLNVNGE